MDGFASEAAACDGCAAALADLLARVSPPAVIALALVILLVVAGLDAAHPQRGARR